MPGRVWMGPPIFMPRRRLPLNFQAFSAGGFCPTCGAASVLTSVSSFGCQWPCVRRWWKVLEIIDSCGCLFCYRCCPSFAFNCRIFTTPVARQSFCLSVCLLICQSNWAPTLLMTARHDYLAWSVIKSSPERRITWSDQLAWHTGIIPEPRTRREFFMDA